MNLAEFKISFKSNDKIKPPIDIFQRQVSIQVLWIDTHLHMNYE